MFTKLTKKQTLYTLLTAITLPLVVISCGGGGGGAPAATGGPSLSSAVASSQEITITQENSTEVMSKALLSITNGSGFSSSQVPATTTGATLSGTTSKETVVKMAKGLIGNIHKSQSFGAAILGATTACTNGGSVITTPDNVPASGTIVDGTYSFTASNCKEGTTTTNGGVTIVVTGLSTLDINGNPTNFNATITFNALTVSDSGLGTIVSVNGGFSISYSTNALMTTFSFSGTSLSVRDANGVIELKNFNVSYNEDIAAQTETFEINYTLSSSFVINGTITVATNVPFVTTIGKAYPKQGQITVTGAGGSKCRLTVNSGTGLASDTVTLEVDPTGAGYDSTLTKVLMWSQL